MNESCEGEHEWKDVNDIKELLPEMQDFLTTDRWKKVFTLTNSIQEDRSLRQFLGLEWKTATDLAMIAILGCAYLNENISEKEGSDEGAT